MQEMVVLLTWNLVFHTTIEQMFLSIINNSKYNFNLMTAAFFPQKCFDNCPQLVRVYAETQLLEYFHCFYQLQHFHFDKYIS